MNEKRIAAIQAFESGFNCAQSVVMAYQEELGFDENQAMQMAVGFGGGMGRLQEKCGAVTGAFMVLGMFSSLEHTDNLSRKNRSYGLIQQFDQRFTAIHQTTQCRQLLNCDLRTDDGHAFAVDNKLFQKICQKCIADAIDLVDDLVKK